AAAVLRNAVTWFAQPGAAIERVLPDNGSCHRSHRWRQTRADLGITPKRTRPHRPQANGKLERFHRTLADGWAVKKFHSSESARRAAPPAWLHHDNHHRPHTAIGRSAPMSRLTNVSDQYT
ncbi:MAG: integrase core domain-containing protein, partial [Streptosporangiaceae bacterium]